MLTTFIEFAGKVGGLLWGPWTLVFIAFVALYLNVKSGFLPFCKFGFIMKSTIGTLFKKDKERLDDGRLTPFQSTAVALAGTVGMGNIAGVAGAISVGGPGAVFWMWVFALIGMISKTAEISLAVHYRDVLPDGSIKGGPMYYMEKGLGWKLLAKLFSLGVFINAILAAGTLQPHTVGRSLLVYNINPYITTAVLALITGWVVIRGDKKIGEFSERLVPIMAILYLIVAVFIFVINWRNIPGVFGLIFSSAFKPSAAIGGFGGAAVAAALRNGASRGMLSNEAGLGTSPMVHARANVDHPIEQGMWGAFEVFFDTMIICTLTAFLILSTDALGTGLSGVELTTAGMSEVIPSGIANLLMAILITSFCLSTQIGFFIYYETAVINVFGANSIKIFRWLYLIPGVIFAGVNNVDALWVFADVATGVCAIPNLIGVLALSGVYFKLQKDYFSGEHKYATKITDNTRVYIREPERVSVTSK